MKTYNPTTVRKGVRYYAKQVYTGTFSDGAKGRIIGAFNKALDDGKTPIAEIDTRRHLVMAWVCTPDEKPFRANEMSSKNLTGADWLGLSRWFSQPGDNGLWYPREAFPTETRWVLNRAQVDNLLVTEMATDGKELPTMLNLVSRWVSGQGDIPVQSWYNLDDKPVAIYQGDLVLDIILEQDTTGMDRYKVVTTKRTYKNLMPFTALQVTTKLPEQVDIEPGGMVQSALKFLGGEIASDNPKSVDHLEKASEYAIGVFGREIKPEPEPEQDDFELSFP